MKLEDYCVLRYRLQLCVLVTLSLVLLKFTEINNSRLLVSDRKLEKCYTCRKGGGEENKMKSVLSRTK